MWNIADGPPLTIHFLANGEQKFKINTVRQYEVIGNGAAISDI